jgi:heat shock protein HslJ
MKTIHGIAAASGLALALIALAGCAPASPSGGPSAVGTWGTDAPEQPLLVLAADGSLSGTDGCNQLAGEWTQSGMTVDFGDVASTRMLCSGVDTWLIDLATGTLDGTTLHILDNDGTEIGTLGRG